jgi:hypothetical protein
MATLKDTIRSLANLRQYRQNRPPPASGGLDASLAMLRAWQSARLAHTHADLLASPHFGPACQFFLDTIYAPRDFRQRDHDAEYLYALMARFLPDFMLSAARKAIELNHLTNQLDQGLLKALVEDLGVTDTITPQLYAEAYRICDNYAERAEQINLMVALGRQVELGTRIPMVGTTLRLARHPARRAGWNEVQDFLEAGYKAFKHMGANAKLFLNTLRQREMHILDNIFAGAPDPFDLSDL